MWECKHLMRIMLVAVLSVEAEFQLRMARRLAAQGHDVLIICRDPIRTIARAFADRGLPLAEGVFGDRPALVDAASGVQVVPWHTADVAAPGSVGGQDLLEQGLALERKYGIRNLRAEVASEHLYEERVVEDCAPELLACYPAWERLLDLWTPDAVFTGDGGDNIRTSLLHCLARRGLPLYHQSWPPAPGMTCFGADNLYTMDTLPLDDERPETADELAWATAYVQGIRQGTLNFILRRPAPSLLPGVRHVRRLLTGRQTLGYTLAEWVRRARRQPVARRVAKCVVEPADEPFVFFPLHVTDDAQLTVRSPLLAAQFTAVDLVARSLPVGMSVYVKEHPALVGTSPAALMDPLLRMPNVKLIHPRWHPHELIRRSRLVCVINSTAGLEALALERPVICLGKPFYAGWGLTHDWGQAVDLPALVRHALQAALPTDQALLRVICRLRRNCYQGTQYVLDGSTENAAVTAESLLQAIADRQQAQVR